MNLGKSLNLEFLRSGPSGMYMDAICMLWRHGMCCMDMLCVFWGWNMLYGHAICPLGIEYAVWICYMSSGDGICCMDMVYAFLSWNIFS